MENVRMNATKKYYSPSIHPSVIDLRPFIEEQRTFKNTYPLEHDLGNNTLLNKTLNQKEDMKINKTQQTQKYLDQVEESLRKLESDARKLISMDKNNYFLPFSR